MNDKILKIKKSTLVDIADQVRAKTGSTDKIKVKDLDEAVANLQGGGNIEVDVLPEIMVVTGREAVPASTDPDDIIKLDTIHFNTSLTLEETIAEFKKIFAEIDAYYGKEMSCYEYSIGFLDENYNAINELHIGNEWSSLEDGSYAYSDEFWLEHITGTIFDPELFEFGWNPDFNGKLDVSGSVFVVAQMQLNENIDWGDENYIGDHSNDNHNQRFVNLFYVPEETLNPEIDVESIYKLPDGSMWMAQDREWCPFGKKYSPEQLGTYNNPEFGFYFGQVFGLDTPISIDISILNQKLVESGNAYYGFDGNGPYLLVPSHDYYGNYAGMSPLPIGLSKNTDTGELNLSLGNRGGYNALYKHYVVNQTDVFTITIRQLYKDAYQENMTMSAGEVDGLLNAFPFKFGVVLPGSNYNGIPGYSDNSQTDNNLNLPELAVFKAIKIGE
jgi:hypothetical protein